MDDDALVRAFESCDPGLSPFTHEQHLRVAFWYLSRESLGRAAERFKDALQRFAASRGKPQLYHATMTWAYLCLLAEKLEVLGPGATFEAIKRRWPRLLDHPDGELGDVYSPSELAAPDARCAFVLPRRPRDGTVAPSA